MYPLVSFLIRFLFIHKCHLHFYRGSHCFFHLQKANSSWSKLRQAFSSCLRALIPKEYVKIIFKLFVRILVLQSNVFHFVETSSQTKLEDSKQLQTMWRHNSVCFRNIPVYAFTASFASLYDKLFPSSTSGNHVYTKTHKTTNYASKILRSSVTIYSATVRRASMHCLTGNTLFHIYLRRCRIRILNNNYLVQVLI